MALSDRLPRLRRLSSLILLLAAVAVYFGVVSPNAAEDHVVSLNLQGPIDQLTRVETIWTQRDAPESEAVGGTILNFEIGHAPAEIKTTVHAPAGSYWLEVNLVRGASVLKVRRRITLESGDTTVFIPVQTP